MTPQNLYDLLAAPARDPNMSVRMLRLLCHLYITNDDRRLCNIALTLQISPAALSRNLDQVCHMKLVKRVRNEEDRRIMTIHLTDEGRAYITALCA